MVRRLGEEKKLVLDTTPRADCHLKHTYPRGIIHAGYLPTTSPAGARAHRGPYLAYSTIETTLSAQASRQRLSAHASYVKRARRKRLPIRAMGMVPCITRESDHGLRGR